MELGESVRMNLSGIICVFFWVDLESKVVEFWDKFCES